MKRHHIRISKRTQIIVTILAFIGLAGILWYINYDEKKQKDYWGQIAEEKMQEEELEVENAINLSFSDSGYSSEILRGGTLYLSGNEIQKNWEETNFNTLSTSVLIKLDKTIDADEYIYLLRFKMKAEDSVAKIKVSFGEPHTYYLNTTWSEYYYPCIAGNIDSIKWSLESNYQKVELSDIEIWQFPASDVNMQKLQCGAYSLADYEKIELDENGLDFGSGNMDVKYVNGYLISIGRGTLFIGQEDLKGEIRTIGYLEGLGEVRHLEIMDDKTVAVASRMNGIYLIDISDKSSPMIISHYDTLEIANDICFAGNYMFVAGRYFGVEIVDVTDLSNPVFVNKIVNSKECYRVVVSNYNLFVSCWATGEIEIYDISIIDEPQYISTVNVDGRCGETYIADDYIYVVTGHRAMSNGDNVGNPGYGTGNGMTIYDISDPQKPVWCSTIKADGSLFHFSFDDWSIQVSGNYAYFTSSYEGLYIYDIEDPYAPMRVAQVTVPMYKGAGGHYADMTDNKYYVFPYDCSEYLVSPVTGIAVGPGRIYFTCPMSDLYAYDFSEAMPIERQEVSVAYETAGEKAENVYGNVEFFLTDSNVYAIAEYDNYYIIGTDSGIVFTDKSLTEVGTVKTDNPVKDVKVNGPWLITAEIIGVGIYKLEGETVIRYGFYVSDCDNKNISSVAVTNDGNFVIMQTAFAQMEAISIIDKSEPEKVEVFLGPDGLTEVTVNQLGGTGSLYYRNIISNNTVDVIGVIGMNNSIWIKSVGDNLQIVRSYKNSLYRESGGSAYVDQDGNILSICHNGYRVYNPLEIGENQLDELETYKIQGTYINGKATIEKDILVVCNEYEGKVWIINISNISSPALIGYYEILGNPDLCLISDDYILIPARHSGIMKINFS